MVRRQYQIRVIGVVLDMILSHKHRFIFIKTQKTAGTSIEIALSKFCGTQDIITPIPMRDEAVRKELGYRQPQNHWESMWQYCTRDWCQLFLKGRKKLRFHMHMPAQEVIEKTSQWIWEDYYTFCFERNPWDKIISLYFYKHPTEPRPTIPEFVRSWRTEALCDYTKYSIDGRIVVDRVGRYEELPDEMEHLRKILRLNKPIELPHVNASTRIDRRHYRDLLTPEDADIVRQQFLREIDYLNYQF